MESRDNKERQSNSECQSHPTSRLPPRLPPQLPKSAPVHRGGQASSNVDRPGHTPQSTRKLRLPGAPLPKPKTAGHTLKMTPISALPDGKEGTRVRSSKSSPVEGLPVDDLPLDGRVDRQGLTVSSETRGECEPPSQNASSNSSVRGGGVDSRQRNPTHRTSLIEFGPATVPMPRLHQIDCNNGTNATIEDTVVLDVSSSNTILAGDSVVGTIVVDKAKRVADPDVLTRRQPLINVSKPFDPLVELNSELQRLNNEEGHDDSYDEFPTLTLEVSEIGHVKSANDRVKDQGHERGSGNDASSHSHTDFSAGIAEDKGWLENELNGARSTKHSVKIELGAPTKVQSKGLALLGLAICTVVVFFVAIRQGSMYGAAFDVRSTENQPDMPRYSNQDKIPSTEPPNENVSNLEPDASKRVLARSDETPTIQPRSKESTKNTEQILANAGNQNSQGKTGGGLRMTGRPGKGLANPETARKKRNSGVGKSLRSGTRGSISGSSIDRVVVGHAKGIRGCEVEAKGFSAMKHRRTNLCFRINRRPGDRKVLVRWLRNGAQVRQTTHSLRREVRTEQIRAVLPLQAGRDEGSWKVQVLSKKGAVLASKAFKVVE